MSHAQLSVGLMFNWNGLELVDAGVEVSDIVLVVVLPENEIAPQIELELLFVT